MNYIEAQHPLPVERSGTESNLIMTGKAAICSSNSWTIQAWFSMAPGPNSCWDAAQMHAREDASL